MCLCFDVWVVKVELGYGCVIDYFEGIIVFGVEIDVIVSCEWCWGNEEYFLFFDEFYDVIVECVIDFYGGFFGVVCGFLWC